MTVEQQQQCKDYLKQQQQIRTIGNNNNKISTF
jgi:hypothetical protein